MDFRYSMIGNSGFRLAFKSNLYTIYIHFTFNYLDEKKTID